MASRSPDDQKSSRNGDDNMAIIANKNFNSLTELLSLLNVNTVQGIVKSITYDLQSQEVIIRIAKLVERESDIKYQAQSKSSEGKNPELTAVFQHLKYLSPIHGKTYPSLRNHFEEWKVIRQELVEKSKSGAERLDSYFRWGSICRLLGSSVDLIGTVGERFLNHIGSDWAKYALMAASSFGFLGLVATVAEVAMSKGIHDDMNICIKNDEEKFKPIVEWFKQTEELDATVRRIFPYGIDKNIVRQIEAASSHQEDYLKIFNAALVTNAEKAPELFMDRNFLAKVFQFSTDKVAQEWWHRVLIMDHPISIECAKLFVENSLLQIETIVSQSIPALPLEMMRLSTLRLQAKVVLNGLTMYDAFRSLKNDTKSKTSNLLRQLKGKTASELQTLERVVQKLKPE